MLCTSKVLLIYQDRLVSHERKKERHISPKTAKTPCRPCSCRPEFLGQHKNESPNTNLEVCIACCRHSITNPYWSNAQTAGKTKEFECLVILADSARWPAFVDLRRPHRHCLSLLFKLLINSYSPI